MTFVALITGASSGIGEATARRLAREPDTELILLARRADRLQALASELGRASALPLDLTDADAPRRAREHVEQHHRGRLHLLVNNAGARWSSSFAAGGWENVERHMRVDFDAQVRLTEALLPSLRATAAATVPSDPTKVSVVNVASTASRVARPESGAYSAAKAALAAWSDSLYYEERPHGVHVGLVLPGFIATEGFPAKELLVRPLSRWIVSRPEVVAEAILEAGPGGRPERYAPRYYWIAAALRMLAPPVIRRAVGRGGFSTNTQSR